MLVGQNLAFRDERQYADGIDYFEESSSRLIGAQTTIDVYGNEVFTTESFNRMRENFEQLIAQYKKVSDVNIINTTKGGANIRGTEFIELEKLMESDLSEETVEFDWLEKRVYSERFTYDYQYMIDRRDQMDLDYTELIEKLKSIEKMLNIIKKLASNRNFKQSEKMYHELNSVFQEVKKNAYFNRFINPMNRVYYDFLNSEFRYIKEEKK